MAEGDGTSRQVAAQSASTNARHLNMLSSPHTDDLTIERLQDDERDLKRSTSVRDQAEMSKSAAQAQKPCRTKHDSRIPLIRTSLEAGWAPASRPTSRPSSAMSVYNMSSVATSRNTTGISNNGVSGGHEGTRFVDHDDYEVRAARLANRFGRALAGRGNATHLNDSICSHSAASQIEVAQPQNVPTNGCKEAVDCSAPHKSRTMTETEGEDECLVSVPENHSREALDLQVPRKCRTAVEATNEVAQCKLPSRKALNSSVPMSSPTMIETGDEVALTETELGTDRKKIIDLPETMRIRTMRKAVDEVAMSKSKHLTESRECLDCLAPTWSRTVVEATMPESQARLQDGVSLPASPPHSPGEAPFRELQATERPSSLSAAAIQARGGLPELAPFASSNSSIGNPRTRTRGCLRARLKTRYAIAVARASSSRSVYAAKNAQEVQPPELSVWRRARQVPEICEIDPALKDTTRSLRP
eukprot:scaffold8397_cov28-Tisochrysis_lutea.AAC.1